jgi:hypothetical protein
MCSSKMKRGPYKINEVILEYINVCLKDSFYFC